MENTFFEAPEYPVLDKFKNSMILFLKYAVALFATVFFIKILEYTYLGVKGQMPSGMAMVFLNALFFDVIFVLKCLPILYLPFLLFFFSLKVKSQMYVAAGVIFSIYIFTYLLLLKYFFTALVPLGSDFYGYSYNDIKQTVSAGLSIDFLSVIIFILPFVFLWVGLKVANKIKPFDYRIGLIVLSACTFLFWFNVSSLPSQSAFKKDYDYNVAINKQAFFFESSYAYFFDDEPNVDIYASNYFEDGMDSDNAVRPQMKYVNSAYPFLREENTVDVLGNFFNIDSAQRPNIVFIQVEGLGRAFSGPNAYLGSFTPFLDELRGRSIYFENFLAAQGRTFASLPSILGSLPFFSKGYNELGANMPKAFTTLSLLKYNGYHSSFIMSTDASFDNESLFIKAQGVNQLISKSNFSEFPASHNSYWGYPDLDLMKKAVGYYAKLPSDKPFVSYIQTISMHTPYKVPEMEKYYGQMESQMKKLGFDEEQKEAHRSYKDQYATVLYSDEAVRYFFQEFAKLPSYHNTIFVITGDHRLPEIPMSTKIDRYHVPLIIYSPMLKKTASIRSVSSHLDIAPSVVKLLQANYKLNTPNLVTWVGTGLDTVRKFRNIHRYPLKQTVADLADYVSGEYFLNGKTLYSMADNFALQPYEDDGKLSQLIGEFNQYKTQNNQVSLSYKLIPDSLYRKFKP
ncbi:MAG: LTA synthase family protein [Flavobacterium sp.]|nr:MAG: LTA synthase family protein [Flavobacterium sp.]